MNLKLLHLAGVFILSLGVEGRAQPSPALAAAMAPLAEGVPEVAIERLQGFLAQNPAAAEKTLAMPRS